MTSDITWAGENCYVFDQTEGRHSSYILADNPKDAFMLVFRNWGIFQNFNLEQSGKFHHEMVKDETDPFMAITSVGDSIAYLEKHVNQMGSGQLRVLLAEKNHR